MSRASNGADWPIELTQPEFLPVSAWTGHLPFAFWVVEALAPRTIVELGVHTGASYCGFCQAVRVLGQPTACFGIDTWEGDDHAGHYGAGILETLRAQHDPRYGGFSRLVQSTFDAANAHFADGSIDLLHIDGLHTYEAVRHDFDTWRPKLSDRAVVLFHDTNVRERDFGVWRLWDELRAAHPHFTFLHAHGLGVLGVGHDLPAPLRDLFALDSQGVARTRARFSALGQRLVEMAALQERLAELTATLAERDHQLEERREELGRYHHSLVTANQAVADAAARDDALEELRRAREAGEEEKARLLQERTGLERAIHGQRARIADLEIAVAEERAAGEARVRAAMATALPPPPAPPARPVAFSLSRALSFASRVRRALRRRIGARLASRLTAIPQASAAGQPSVVPPDLFDSAWYMTTHPDIARAGLDPWQHFLEYGLVEGRSPNAFFDSAWYLRTYQDVASAGGPALLHYLRFGAAEGRNPHPEFDAAWYVVQHPEAAENPLLHHMRVGRHQGWPTAPVVAIADYLPSTHPAPLLPARVTVDIVIPVYRGLEETRRCLESVLADRERPSGEIIVLDDCSPEPALSRWLDEVAATGRIRLLRNPGNLGFVRSVNRGMEAAGRHDVVLLNSDTEVPQGWLRRLMAHAHAGERIGTVTPFSNNATICSYPSLQGGPLPLGLDLATLDAAFQGANAGRTVDLPTAVGFAMYIRRDCLDAVGLFDAETFGRGYGEENDFCLRATAQGWTHLLACDTFVYHAGEVSFGENSPLRDRAGELILARHPDYLQRVRRHVQLDPAAPARFAATAELFRNGERPVILLICHALGGGTERHVQELIERTSGQAEYLILRPTSAGCELSVPAMPGHPVLRLPGDQVENLATLLRHCGVRRVHIHHVYGYDMDMRRLIHLLGVPFDVTVHDYFGICPRVNLVSQATGRYCAEPDEAGCNACIAGTPETGTRDILSWRWQHRWLFTEADRVLCPSRDVQRRLARHGIRARTLVVPHDQVTEPEWRVAVSRPAPGERLRVAVLGTLADHKGAAAVRAAALAAPPDRFEFILIGASKPALDLPSRIPFRETGAYGEAELPRLITELRPHLIWFPASWPETYSYTLNAAIEAGLPAVASEIGAFPERLEGHPWTWLVPPGADASAWLATFEAVRAALVAGTPPRAAVTRTATEAFYPEAYLAPARATPLPATEPAPRVRDLRVPGRVAVLAVPEVMDNGAYSPCAYIRLLLPLDHLAQRGIIDLTLATPAEALRYQADVMVCQRYSAADLPGAEQLIGHARRHGMRLLYDLDDNLLDVPDEHPEAAMLRRRAAVIARFVAAADAVLASTEPLRVALLPRQPRVIVVENGLDERLLSPRVIAPASERAVGILYMGTATHDADLALVEAALLRLQREFGSHIRIGVIGVTARAELPPGVERVGVPESASHSYPAFLSWLVTQGDWDIGIAPLADSAFNLSKSAIKAMDYMAMGVVAVVSDVMAYRALPEDAVLRVANDPDAWHEALAGLIRDPGRRRRLATTGRQCLFSRYTLAAQARLRMEAWQLAISEPAVATSAEPHLVA